MNKSTKSRLISMKSIALTIAVIQLSYIAYAVCPYCQTYAYHTSDATSCYNSGEAGSACRNDSYDATGGNCTGATHGTQCITTTAVVTDTWELWACNPDCSDTLVANGTHSAGSIQACYDETEPACD
jgi:hypothetical protein